MITLLGPLRASLSRGFPDTLIRARLSSLAVSYLPALGGNREVIPDLRIWYTQYPTKVRRVCYQSGNFVFSQTIAPKHTSFHALAWVTAASGSTFTLDPSGMMAKISPPCLIGIASNLRFGSGPWVFD